MKNILDKDFKFNKKFGQNFIFDTNFLNSVAADAELDKETEVLEIGTGAATLTKVLATHAKKVVSFEIDNNLKTTIASNLEEVSNVKVVFKIPLFDQVLYWALYASLQLPVLGTTLEISSCCFILFKNFFFFFNSENC